MWETYFGIAELQPRKIQTVWPGSNGHCPRQAGDLAKGT